VYANNEYPYVTKGSILEKQKKYQEAIEAYEKAIKMEPKLLEAYLNIGHIYQYNLKNINKAIEIYKIGLSKSPNNFDLNLNLMNAYFENGQNDDGINQYVILAKIRPDNMKYYFTRDAIQQILQNYKEEEKYIFCKEYLKLNPTDIILREVLVDIFINRKDYKSAENELNLIIQYGNTSGSIYFDLGTCNYHLGDYDASLGYFQKAKDLGVYVPQPFFDKLKENMKGKQRDHM
jgi:tetratricopeptide (TPR) repeat protein